MALIVQNNFDGPQKSALERFREAQAAKAEADKRRAERQPANGEKRKWENFDLRFKLNTPIIIHRLWSYESAMSFYAHNRYMQGAPKDWGWRNRLCLAKNFPNHHLDCPLCKIAEEEIKKGEAEGLDAKKMGPLWKARAKEQSVWPVVAWESLADYEQGVAGAKWRYMIKPAPNSFETYNPYGALFKFQEDQEKAAKDFGGKEGYDVLEDPRVDLKITWTGPTTVEAKYEIERITRREPFPEEVSFKYPRTSHDLARFIVSRDYNDRQYLYLFDDQAGTPEDPEYSQPEEEEQEQPHQEVPPPNAAGMDAEDYAGIRDARQNASTRARDMKSKWTQKAS